MPDTPRFITGRKFAEALRDAGIVGDLNTVNRIVIDVRADDVVEIRVHHWGDERLLSLAPVLAGAQEEEATDV